MKFAWLVIGIIISNGSMALAQQPKQENSISPANSNLTLINDLPAKAGEMPEQTFLKNIRQVTKGMVKAGEGYFSPDGQQIVYQAVPSDYPFYQIFTQSLAGGEPMRVSTGRGRTTCSYFSPDGKKLLFASSHLDPKLDDTEKAEIQQQADDKAKGVHRRYKWDFDPHSELFELDLTSRTLTRLTNAPGYDAEGAYSRDGKLIPFCSSRDGDPDIYVMHADGSNVRQLTDAPGYDGGPFLSPDGKWVIFRSDRHKAEHLQLYVIGIDGQQETQLTATNGVNWGPYWHPTRPFIIWSGADHSDPTKRPNYDLWLAKYHVSPAGAFSLSQPQRVTDFPGADVLPVFSPDGKQLLWTSTRSEDHSSQLFLADFVLPNE